MLIKNKKRVLIVGQHYWPETFRISDIAEGLAERGYEVDVLCGVPNYPSGKIFKGYGFFKSRKQVHNKVNIYRALEIPRGNKSYFRIAINFISFPLFALLLLPRFMFKKYDRIIAYQLSPVFMSLPAIIISKLKNTPLYFYICDFWPHSLFSIINIKNQFLKRLITSLSYWHYRRADGAMGVFKGIQDRLISEVGLRKENTLYIPQAPEKIYEKRVVDKKLKKRFEDKFTILFAGNINPAQCFDIITKAAKTVYDNGYTKIHYIIVGDGMSKEWLEKEVDRMGIRSQFHFEGMHPVADIPRYQTQADATIVALSKSPLFEYGIPAKVYSYMASGKPMIASMDGEGKRLINQLSQCGYCVNSGDIEGLAKIIQQLFDLPKSERKKMGNNGFKYYKKHFEREHNLDRLEEFVFNNNYIPDGEYV